MIYWFMVRVLPFYQVIFDRMVRNLTRDPVPYMFKYMFGFVLLGIVVPLGVEPIIPSWITFPIFCVLTGPLIYLAVVEYWARFFKNMRR